MQESLSVTGNLPRGLSWPFFKGQLIHHIWQGKRIEEEEEEEIHWKSQQQRDTFINVKFTIQDQIQKHLKPLSKSWIQILWTDESNIYFELSLTN